MSKEFSVHERFSTHAPESARETRKLSGSRELSTSEVLQTIEGVQESRSSAGVRLQGTPMLTDRNSLRNAVTGRRALRGLSETAKGLFKPLLAIGAVFTVASGLIMLGHYGVITPEALATIWTFAGGGVGLAALGFGALALIIGGYTLWSIFAGRNGGGVMGALANKGKKKRK